jgi:hypothetical protein
MAGARTQPHFATVSIKNTSPAFAGRGRIRHAVVDYIGGPTAGGEAVEPVLSADYSRSRLSPDGFPGCCRRLFTAEAPSGRPDAAGPPNR